jgi:hypothetical protein
MLPKEKETYYACDVLQLTCCTRRVKAEDTSNHITKFSHSASVVYGLAYWPLVTKVAGPNPVQNRRNFLRVKNY